MSNKRWTKTMYADIVDWLTAGEHLTEAGLRFGVSTERARQVANMAMRMMLHPSRQGETYDGVGWWDIKDARKHRDFWVRRCNEFRAEDESASP